MHINIPFEAKAEGVGHIANVGLSDEKRTEIFKRIPNWPENLQDAVEVLVSIRQAAEGMMNLRRRKEQLRDVRALAEAQDDPKIRNDLFALIAEVEEVVGPV